MSKIKEFQKKYSIGSADLARASGLSEEMIYLLRKGQNTTIETAKRVAVGASKLLKGRAVAIEDLFDLSVPVPRSAPAKRKRA